MGEARKLWEQTWRLIEGGRLDELVDVFAPDAEMLTSSAAGVGADYVRGVFTRHLAAYPDLTHETVNVVESADGQQMAAELVFHGTHKGALRHPNGQEIPPTGRPLSWTAIDWVRAEDGRIVSWHALFDRLELLGQLQAAGAA